MEDTLIEPIEVTTKEKGDSLEKEFAIFLTQHEGWRVRVGAHMRGQLNRKGAAVDIIGERPRRDGIIFNKIATYMLIICAVFTTIMLDAASKNGEKT